MGQRIPNRVRAYLKQLGNPYAFTQVDGFEEELPAGSAGRSVEASGFANSTRAADGPRPPEQVELFNHVSQGVGVPTRSGNPYAMLAQLDEDKIFPELPCDEGPDSTTASQVEFEGGCRRIFAQYIPALERGRLRPEHRDFIARNRVKSGRIRRALLQALQRYDLTALGGLQPQFNRERDALTVRKLMEVERSVEKGE
jgi:hypothetical protein